MLVRHRRALAGALAAVTAATTLALVPGTGVAEVRQAGRPAAVPGDQPLPGYTIVNPPLAPLVVDGRPTRVVQGVHQHAAYDIEVPARWNGELVMWAHGYRGTGRVLTVDPPQFGLRERLLRQGYAWAASSYAENDYDVRTGVTTTKGLADLAARTLGREPRRTYLAGVSMGGHVIGRSLEQYPTAYDGALPMCGVLGDQELFDYFLGYNLVAQDLADRQVYPPPADYLTADVPVIQQRLGLAGLRPGGPDTTNALGKQLRAVTTNLSGGPRPGADQAFAVWKDFLFTLYTPDNGGPLSQNAGRLAQNLRTTYAPNAPVDVNASVQRVAPTDPVSRRTHRLTQVPRIEGRPRVPVMTLHGLGDLFVPFSMEQVYRREVARQGRSDLLVQRAVRAAGHCEFTPTEVGRAWDDLTRWVESRGPGRGLAKGRPVARPAGDDVLTASTVASPTYGCRFTDPAAYASPGLFPTRALYPRCPAG
ncbi:hypothetical protein [Nocardioides aurantiacus]|uniref:Prolyl oligopeptidase family protein n=1 Tax=Nocardioides aurantiacus TaxID=86796 RepID=A0A3N2CXL0_9ACTN|nr:hypothetical protein [Nocardioides aurantiacus]ROR92277.1 hypothetical protein EDD33_3165 [Nocardioides aurantiacus]